MATLEAVCAWRDEDPATVRAWIAAGLTPGASHVAPDGTELFRSDYFDLIDRAGGPHQLRRWFEAACGSDADWEAYRSGVYGATLRELTPSSITRAGELIRSIRWRLEDARARDEDWHAAVSESIAELDKLLIASKRFTRGRECERPGRRRATASPTR